MIFDHPLEVMLDPRLFLNKGQSLVDVYVSYLFGVVFSFRVVLLRRKQRACAVAV
jgi:hypothetical protein